MACRPPPPNSQLEALYCFYGFLGKNTLSTGFSEEKRKYHESLDNNMYIYTKKLSKKRKKKSIAK